jgi:hypothetical protein
MRTSTIKIIAIILCVLGAALIAHAVHSRGSFIGWQGSRHHVHRHSSSFVTPPKRMWVSLATDLSGHRFAVNIPLTAYVWSQFMKIKPIVFIVPQSIKVSDFDQFIIEWTRKAGAHVEIIFPREGDFTSTVSQTVRLAAWALPFVDRNDYIITADADIWPVSGMYWDGIFSFTNDITIVNGEFYHQNAGSDNRVAISYVGMKASQWAAVVSNFLVKSNFTDFRDLKINKDATSTIQVDQVVAGILDVGRSIVGPGWDAPQAQGPGDEKKGHAQWSWDQRFLTKAILSANETRPLTIAFGKELMSRRLDRINWHQDRDIDKHSDAHLPFPLTNAGPWSQTRNLFASMFGSGDWADAYYDKLMNLVEF